MRLVTFRLAHGALRLGILSKDVVIDVEKFGAAHSVTLPNDMLGLIDNGMTLVPILQELLRKAKGSWPAMSAVPLENVTIAAPIPRPRKNIFGIGLNYHAHVAESARALDTDKALPKQPVVFSKPPTTVVGNGSAIHHNAKITQQLDWEVELAVIIGTTAKGVKFEDAMRHVFGYSVIIDISARDNRRAGQWLISKGLDTYAPFGPCIVTADEIQDPRNLHLWLKKNGEMKQDGNTGQMIFSIPFLISDLSAGITLEPGDIIATGTPDGIGAGRTPQEWLWPGDVIEAGIDGIGILRNPIIAV